MPDNISVKLCGFTEEKSLQIAIDCCCDFIGFVFYKKSPRNISLEMARKLAKIIPSNIAKVAVVVDAKNDLISQIQDYLSPQLFQFHGSESSSYIKNFKQNYPDTKIIKAFPVSKKQDFNSLEQYNELCDYFLFDSKVDNNFGGNGIAIDWKLLQNINIKKNWFLSGGLNVDNIEIAISTSGTKMIDISSGIEEIRGTKSGPLIKDLMKKIKNLNDN